MSRLNPHLPNKRYDYSKAVRLKHLLLDDFLGGLDFGRQLCKQRRRKLGNAIFLEFIRIALEEIMADNSRLVFPTTPALVLYIRKKPERDLLYSVLTKGIYTDVSLWQSDGKIYEFALYSEALGQTRPVRIAYSRYKELMARVNNGQRYRER
jgi:hypothetical protein